MLERLSMGERTKEEEEIDSIDCKLYYTKTYRVQNIVRFKNLYLTCARTCLFNTIHTGK